MEMVSSHQPWFPTSSHSWVREGNSRERVLARKVLAVLDSENPPKCAGLDRAASMDLYIEKDRQFLDLTSGAL